MTNLNVSLYAYFLFQCILPEEHLNQDVFGYLQKDKYYYYAKYKTVSNNILLVQEALNTQ